MTRILAFSVVALVVLAPPPAYGQMPTVVVSVADTTSPSRLHADLAERFIGNLSRASAFDVDTRADPEKTDTYHLSSSLWFSASESYNEDSGEYTTDLSLRVNILVRDPSGRLALTDGGEAEGTWSRSATTDSRGTNREMTSCRTRPICSREDAARSVFRYLTSRLTMYFEIIGDRPRVGVEGTAAALLEAGFYHASVRAYRDALDANPGSSDILFPLSVAQMGSGDEYAAHASFTDLIDAGFSLELAATHGHAFGSCDGTFRLTRESASYQSPRDDDPDHRFDVPLDWVVDSGLRGNSLRVRAPSEEHVEKDEGDSKNWTLDFDDGWNASRAVARLISGYLSRR